jgi:hypothetical protein
MRCVVGCIMPPEFPDIWQAVSPVDVVKHS